jgi:hypothetical protein
VDLMQVEVHMTATRAVLLGSATLLALAGPAFAESRAYTLPPFKGVSVSGGISAVINVGGAQEVTADASTKAILDRLDVYVRDNTLTIGFKWDVLDWLFNFGQNKGVLVHVTAPSFSSVAASAAADVDVGKISADMLNLDSSSGASVAAQDVTGGRVSANSSSGGNLAVGGSCDQLIGNASSGGSLAAHDFKCTNVDVNASSGGHASIRATVSVDADASSGGSIAVFGSAPDVRSNTSSGGTISFAE